MSPELPIGYTSHEELAHRITHGVGLAGSLAVLPWLAYTAVAAGDTWRLVSGLIFGGSALLLFSTSVMYHSSVQPARRLLWRRLDHAAIYVLIAGSYTPFTLGVLRGGWGWTLFGLIWALAIIGVVAKTTRLGFRYHRTSVALYLLMGWLAIIAVRPLSQQLTSFQLAWLGAGGLLYTAGVPFYLWKTRPFAHAAWHVFVLAGVACHAVAVASVMTAR